MLVAKAGDGWVEVILLASIVVPVAITGVLVWIFLRRSHDNPDEQRLRGVQRDWKDRQAEERTRKKPSG